jgi:large subunit ribosomal protein L9
MAMELILTQDVEHLGRAGQIVSVKNGYGRNFLLPKGLAVLATRRNKSRLEHEQGVIERRVEKQRADAESVATRINGMTLQFERRVGDDEKLYGSVTSRDIGSQLEVAGVVVDHRKIKLAEPVKSLGKFEVDIKLGAGITATLKYWVVAEEAAPAPE